MLGEWDLQSWLQTAEMMLDGYCQGRVWVSLLVFIVMCGHDMAVSSHLLNLH